MRQVGFGSRAFQRTRARGQGPIFKQAEREAAGDQSRFLYRNFAGGTLESEGGHGA